MVEIALILVVVGAVLVLIASRRGRAVRWQAHLRRLHPGVQHKAEWMAPDEIVRAVESDYLAAHYWMAQAMLSGYIRFLNEAPLYFAGSYLRRQQKIATAQLQSIKTSVRYVGVLSATHQLKVRHFSDDGLICYLVDFQTSRKLTTYEYWKLRSMHVQALDPVAYVFRMVFDNGTRRWKIEDLVQQLPRGWEEKAISDSELRLDENLPIAAGRDT